MFIYTEKYTESEKHIQNINLLYKIHQRCQNTFEQIETSINIKKHKKWLFRYLNKFHNSYFVFFVYFVFFDFFVYFCIVVYSLGEPLGGSETHVNTPWAPSGHVRTYWAQGSPGLPGQSALVPATAVWPATRFQLPRSSWLVASMFYVYNPKPSIQNY